MHIARLRSKLFFSADHFSSLLAFFIVQHSSYVHNAALSICFSSLIMRTFRLFAKHFFVVCQAFFSYAEPFSAFPTSNVHIRGGSAVLVGHRTEGRCCLILDRLSSANKSAKYRAKETPPETASHSWNFRNSAS